MEGFCRATPVAPLKGVKADTRAGKRPDTVGSAKFNDSAGTSGASDLGNASFTELKGHTSFWSSLLLAWSMGS